MPGAPMVSVAVEGESDTGMVTTLLAHVGLELARPCVVRNGVGNLDKLIDGLSGTNAYNPWIVFRDSDGECPVALRERLVGGRPHDAGFEVRLACSMTEAWLLADVIGVADFFHVARSKVPRNPDELPHAKEALLRLCGSSRSQPPCKDMVRDNGKTGPLSVTRLNEFAREHWDVARACTASPSLTRTVARLSSMRDLLAQVLTEGRTLA